MSNGKSAPSDPSSSSSPEEEGNNIKNAADLLLKGGTLLSSSCDNCGGVQIKFKENIVCVNCGRKVKEINSTQIEEEKIKKEKKNTNNNNQSDLSNKNNVLVQSKPEYKDAKISNDIEESGEKRNIELLNLKRIIDKKITSLITDLEKDHDILIQNNKLDLISKYLDVLYKIKMIGREI
ncbi:MAG TPA: autoantigen p27 domain-containing protein [Nitrososphaeraceae archaeon]|nr:autoantigen p27 domain-containing protein [Nitrososphaeraceae archaeon]